MKRGVRLELFLAAAMLLALTIGAVDLWVTRAVSGHVEASIRSDLRVRADLIARQAGQLGAPMDDLAAWDREADALAAAGRVTLLDLQGRVLGDSEVALNEVPALQNHADRPELIEALERGHGEAVRRSATVEVRMLYVAVPIVRGGTRIGLARVARTLDDVARAEAEVESAVLASSAIAAGIGLLVALVAAHRFSARVEGLRDTARRMTRGDLAVRARSQGTDELSELGRSLDGLAESLQSTLAKLRSERDLMGSILEGMQEGVLVLDADGSVVLVNAAFRAVALLPADTAGMQLVEVVRHAPLHDLLRRARTQDAPVAEELELPGLPPRRLLVNAARLDEDEGRVLAVLVDVTNLRRLETLRRDFVANVSHELRTPVAAVRSATETLAAGALEEPVAARRFLDIIGRNSMRLQSLIEDLLELSRIESKELRLKKEALDLRVVVPSVFALFRERAERSGVALRTDIAEDAWEATGDVRAVEQVLTNLVENAVKYGPRGPVTVAATRDGDDVLLHVTDAGPGIAAEHLPRIFERFYRVDPGRSRDLGGTGLGLSIVKHLAEAMGGEVDVDSVPGRGTTFTVRLPGPAPRDSM